MDAPLLRVDNLSQRYAGGFSLDIPRLEFHSGRIYGVIGPNGAGKTTMLNLLNLLEKPAAGRIFFRGEPVNNADSLGIRRRMGMIMEKPLLFRTTVYKNITAGLRFRSVDKKMWPQLAAEALSLVGLAGFEERYAPSLSGGEAQRVAIARALVLKPEVLFLDEPFSNVDQRSIELIEGLLKTVNQRDHTTIVFTTHDLEQAHRLADEVISLVGGRVVQASLENLFTGEVEEADGSTLISLSPRISLAVVTGKRGRVHLCIPPQDIILSHQPIESSARNSFSGVIKKIQLEDQAVRVTVRVDAGIELIARITKTSYEEMNLFLDSPIFLTFKSTAVKVL
jgi:tungstate transport system ATP-binding protein